jgi:Flp pilus assembly pilin Flp
LRTCAREAIIPAVSLADGREAASEVEIATLEAVSSEAECPVVSRQKTTSGLKGRWKMSRSLHKLWSEDDGQDIAEYAVMLAVILVLVVGTIRLIGSNANNVFSATASSIQ